MPPLRASLKLLLSSSSELDLTLLSGCGDVTYNITLKAFRSSYLMPTAECLPLIHRRHGTKKNEWSVSVLALIYQKGFPQDFPVPWQPAKPCFMEVHNASTSPTEPYSLQKQTPCHNQCALKFIGPAQLRLQVECAHGN